MPGKTPAKSEKAIYIIPGAWLKINIRSASHDVYMLDKRGEPRKVYSRER